MNDKTPKGTRRPSINKPRPFTLIILVTLLLSSIRNVDGFTFLFRQPSPIGNVANAPSSPRSGRFKLHPHHSEYTAGRTTSRLTLKSSVSNEPLSLAVEEKDFCMGYLNKHHPDALLSLALVFTKIGTDRAKKNAFSGGTYMAKKATMVDIIGGDEESGMSIVLDVAIKLRGKEEELIETVTLSLDADPNPSMSREFKPRPPLSPLLLNTPPPSSTSPTTTSPLSRFLRQMNRLFTIAKHPNVTGKLIQLGFQFGLVEPTQIHENLYLNQVPHNRFVRKYFYEAACQACLQAVTLCSQKLISNRMRLDCIIPETNPSMDSYRIGTLLELARSMAITLAEQNLRVRVCVQGSMGVGIFTGLPKSLSGVPILLQRMDWQSGEGEANEGMVGNYVNFGSVGRDSVIDAHTTADGDHVEQDDVFIIICPQSMVGLESSIIGPLREMVDAAADRPVILLNPDLSDKVSAQGQQSVRGRKERMEFADSFKTIFQFRCLYVSGTSYFPILGAAAKWGPLEPWIAYQRRDLVDGGGELYVPMLASEEKPEGESIMECFEM